MPKTLDELENEVPALAERALKEAYKKALEAGLSVMVSSNGFLYKVKPDGSRVRIKALDPDVPVARGASHRVK